MENNMPPKTPSKKPQPRRSGQIISRGKDKWLVSVFLGKDSNGKKRYSSKIVKGKRSEAEKFLRGKLSELDRGEFVEPSKEILNTFLDLWLEEAARPKLAQRTYEDYEETLARYVRPKLGLRKLSQLEQSEIQSLYSEMLGGGLSGKTVRATHNILNSALKWAIKKGKLAYNPAVDVDLPRKQKKEMRAMNDEEARRFLEVAKDSLWGLVFRFALETGMRPEEYLALKWGDLDLDRRTATVQRTLCWKRKARASGGDPFYFGQGKTAKSRRTLPLSSSLVEELKRHRDFQLITKQNFADRYRDLNLVFTMPLGAPINTDTLGSKYFKPVLVSQQPSIRTIASVASCWSLGSTWQYVSRVKATLACPNLSLTTFGFTPLVSKSVAQECRRS
jgi:integrase